MSFDDLHDMAEEDIKEGMDRMMNEGGGVVVQNIPAGKPIQRNYLVNVEDDRSENQASRG